MQTPDLPLPHDIQAELQLLGCLQFGRDDDRIRREHFYVRGHRFIFDVLVEMEAEGEPVEAHLVARRLEQRGQLDQVGGVRKIIDILEAIPYADHVAHYADIVLEKYRRRRLSELADELQRLAYDPTADVEQAAASIDLAEILDEGPAERFPTLTCSQLAHGRFDLHYLVAGLLVAGQPCVVAGEKKTLKTNLLIDLSLSLANGNPFLGQFAVPRPVRVGLLSGESGRATIQETARRVARGKGFDLEHVDGVLFCFDLPMLGDARDERHIRRFIERHELQVLILDPAYLCMAIGDDAGNLFKVGRLLSGITRIGEASGCTMVVCHHTRKRPKDKPSAAPELEHIAWSGFQEWARRWLLIGRREPYCPDQGGQHRLWLSFGGSAGHSGLWGVDINEGTRQDEGGRRWDVDVLTIADVNERKVADRDEQRDEDARDAVLRHLQDNAAGDTQSSIREAVRINHARCKQLIELMVDEGDIEPCEVTKSGRSYEGYRLPLEPGQWEKSDNSIATPSVELFDLPGQLHRDSITPRSTESDGGGAARSLGGDGSQSDAGGHTPVGGVPPVRVDHVRPGRGCDGDSLNGTSGRPIDE